MFPFKKSQMFFLAGLALCATAGEIDWYTQFQGFMKRTFPIDAVLDPDVQLKLMELDPERKFSELLSAFVDISRYYKPWYVNISRTGSLSAILPEEVFETIVSGCQVVNNSFDKYQPFVVMSGIDESVYRWFLDICLTPGELQALTFGEMLDKLKINLTEVLDVWAYSVSAIFDKTSKKSLKDFAQFLGASSEALDGVVDIFASLKSRFFDWTSWIHGFAGGFDATVSILERVTSLLRGVVHTLLDFLFSTVLDYSTVSAEARITAARDLLVNLKSDYRNLVPESMWDLFHNSNASQPAPVEYVIGNLTDIITNGLNAKKIFGPSTETEEWEHILDIFLMFFKGSAVMFLDVVRDSRDLPLDVISKRLLDGTLTLGDIGKLLGSFNSALNETYVVQTVTNFFKELTNLPFANTSVYKKWFGDDPNLTTFHENQQALLSFLNYSGSFPQMVEMSDHLKTVLLALGDLITKPVQDYMKDTYSKSPIQDCAKHAGVFFSQFRRLLLGDNIIAAALSIVSPLAENIVSYTDAVATLLQKPEGFKVSELLEIFVQGITTATNEALSLMKGLNEPTIEAFLASCSQEFFDIHTTLSNIAELSEQCRFADGVNAIVPNDVTSNGNGTSDTLFELIQARGVANLVSTGSKKGKDLSLHEVSKAGIKGVETVKTVIGGAVNNSISTFTGDYADTVLNVHIASGILDLSEILERSKKQETIPMKDLSDIMRRFTEDSSVVPPSPTKKPDPSPFDKKTLIYIIAGASGGVLLIIIIIIACVACKRRRRRNENTSAIGGSLLPNY